MDIPLLGNLFKSRGEEIKKTEIVIIITPHIVTGHKEVLNRPIPIIKSNEGQTPGIPGTDNPVHLMTGEVLGEARESAESLDVSRGDSMELMR